MPTRPARPDVTLELNPVGLRRALRRVVMQEHEARLRNLGPKQREAMIGALVDLKIERIGARLVDGTLQKAFSLGLMALIRETHEKFVADVKAGRIKGFELLAESPRKKRKAAASR